MHSPAFWWRPGTGRILSPLAGIYGAVAALRMRAEGRRAGLPVICLGNLTVGGAGKTPAALAVAHFLLAAHERPFFLSRGYGGEWSGPVRVDVAVHNAAQVGDEPLLLARLAPTIVARDRVKGAEAARGGNATVVVMDDGFQNPALKKDLAIVLVDGRRGIGNGRTLPAGPLRAPLETQLAHAQAVLFVGKETGLAAIAERAQHYRAAIFHGRLEADKHVLETLRGRKVLAYAGIGDPEKFFNTLAEGGVNVVERTSFPDHHRYTGAQARALLERANSANLMLITTEKDFVRLTDDPELSSLAARTCALPVRLVIEETDAFGKMILKAAKGNGRQIAKA